MLTVIGLGNPGAAYKYTRHNSGFMLIDGIAEGRFLDDVTFKQSGRYLLNRLFGSKTKFKKTSGPYVYLEGELVGKQFMLVKPTTFMNDSGKVLTSLKSRGVFKDLSEVLVIVDDVDLELGRIRLRAEGSAGGHNGLKSIIMHIGTQKFARLRVGVGPRPNGVDLVKYVLSSFHSDELQQIDEILVKAADAAKVWILNGFESAQKMVLER